jgi:hypothetical protein
MAGPVAEQRVGKGDRLLFYGGITMMKSLVRMAFVVVLCLGLVNLVMAGVKTQGKGKAAKDVPSMSQEEQIKLALSAAPPHIAKDAAVLVFGADGKLKEGKPGANGFTCIPTVMNLPDPDPMCMDAAVKQWWEDLMANAPKPSNTMPGIAYMARGGSHWEKVGRVVMKQEPGAKIVKEPPHWMIMWPFDAKTTLLPTVPNPSGVYVMFDGTPYAHVMVYQDPRKMK